MNNNGIGVCGIAGGSGNNDGVKIMCVQMIAGGRQTTVDGSAEAVRYAADNGASILQCSWGFLCRYFQFGSGISGQTAGRVEAFDYLFIKNVRQSSQGRCYLFCSRNKARVCGTRAYPSVVLQ